MKIVLKLIFDNKYEAETSVEFPDDIIDKYFVGDYFRNFLLDRTIVYKDLKKREK